MANLHPADGTWAGGDEVQRRDIFYKEIGNSSFHHQAFVAVRKMVRALFALLIAVAIPASASEVDLSSGALRLSATDHVLLTPSIPLNITRSYSRGDGKGELGPGWRLDLASRLEGVGKDEVWVRSPIGTQVFRLHGRDEYLGPDGQRITRSGRFSELSTPAGARVRFDAQGREVLRQDGNGNQVSFAYDTQGRLARVAAGGGSEIRFAYGPEGRLRYLEDHAGRKVEYAYDARGQLSRVRDMDGWATSYRYDGQDRITEVKYPDGTSKTYAYDNAGRITQRSDAAGEAERYAYQGTTTRIARGLRERWEVGHDAEGRPIWRQDGSGRRETWAWGEGGQLLGRRYADGSLLNLSYDPQGRLISQESSSGSRLQFTYDTGTGRLQSLDRNGAVTRFQYDERGNVTRIASPAGRTTRFEYDSKGRPAVLIGTAGGRTRLEFNGQGRMVRREGPDGATTQWEFDDRGRLLRQVEPLGRVSTYHYLPNGLLAAAAAPGLPETRFEYDGHGRLTAEPYAGRRTEYGYDKVGRLARVRYGDGTEDRYTYRSDGRLIEQVDRLGNVTHREYGADGRLLQVDLPSGLVARYERPEPGHVNVSLGSARMDIRREAGGRLVRVREGKLGTRLLELDPEGRLLRQVSPMGREEKREYDQDGLLTAVTSPGGEHWRFGYDGAGLLDDIRYPDGLGRRLEYDVNGRLSTLHLPWGGEIRYRYDALGRVKEKINARGQVVHYAYDTANRIVKKQTPDVTWRYRYDANGDLLEAGNGRITQRYMHDANGRLIGLDYVELGQSLRWRRDSLGRVVERTGPGASAVHYGYDRLGRPTLMEAGRALRLDLAYDPRGRLTSTRVSTGVLANYSYDEGDRLTGIGHVMRSDERLALRYGYDDDGNLVSRAVGDGIVRMRYDLDDQLLGESGTGTGATVYRYGPAGQRLAAGHGGKEQAYRYDAGGRLIQAGEVRYAYDADGNRIMRLDARGMTRYAYDAEGRLTAVTLPGGRHIGYGYGPWGERLWREAGGVRTYFMYDGDDLAAELDGAFRPTAMYLYSAADRPWAVLRPDGTRIYHLDAMSNVLALSDADGRIRTRYRQDAFGAHRRMEGEHDPQPLEYAGRPRDPDTGLVYMRARSYDPEVGAFLSPDPVLGTPEDPASLILYSYAHNNPYRYSDTSGLASNGYDPFPEALRGNPPPPPPGLWPGHTATWDFDNYRHELAQGVYKNVRDQARQAEQLALEQARQQRMANPEPGYDNRTVQQTPGGRAANYVRRQAASAGERLRAGASAVGERAGAALNRAAEYVQAGAQRVEAAAQPYAAGAQQLGTVTSRGLLAIRMADVAGDALPADDPTQVLSDRALEFASYAAASAVTAQATNWAAASMPAAATVGGAAVGTAALTAASLERVSAAAEQRGEQWLAEQRADWAEQRAQETTRDITQDRERHLDALRSKAAELQRLRSLLSTRENEAKALELEAANQRNAAQAKAGQAQVLRGNIRSHDAVLTGLRNQLAALDTNKLRTMLAAIEALSQQACAEGGGIDRSGLASQADSQAQVLEARANPAGYSQTMAQLEAEVGVADGYVADAEDIQSALQGYRRAVQERLGMVEGMQAEHTAALQQAHNLQVAVKGSANRLRLFLQGGDLATLSAIAQEASAGLPAEGALTDAVQGARESLGGVDVEALLGGIVADAQSHAGLAAIYLGAVQADYSAAQGVSGQARNAANRARDCVDRLGAQASATEPGAGESAGETPAGECDTDRDCALGYVCDPRGACVRDPRFEQALGEDRGTAPETSPTCRVDTDCRRGEQCRQGQCIAAQPGAQVSTVLGLFGQRENQREQERTQRDSNLVASPSSGGGRYGSAGLHEEISLLQQTLGGQGTPQSGIGGAAVTGSQTAALPSTPATTPTAPGIRVIGPPSQTTTAPVPATTATTTPVPATTVPAAGASGQMQFYLVEVVVAYEKRQMETGVGWRTMSCTLTAYGGGPFNSQAELEADRRRYGESVLGVVAGTKGTTNPRLVHSKVVAGPSPTLIKPPGGQTSRMDCR